jgi:hypothetical protein
VLHDALRSPPFLNDRCPLRGWLSHTVGERRRCFVDGIPPDIHPPDGRPASRVGSTQCQWNDARLDPVQNLLRMTLPLPTGVFAGTQHQLSCFLSI